MDAGRLRMEREPMERGEVRPVRMIEDMLGVVVEDCWIVKYRCCWERCESDQQYYANCELRSVRRKTVCDGETYYRLE